MTQIPLIVDCVQMDDFVETDTARIEALIDEIGADNIVCIFTTTSCFAPRAPDSVDKVGQLCKRHGIITLLLVLEILFSLIFMCIPFIRYSTCYQQCLWSPMPKNL